MREFDIEIAYHLREESSAPNVDVMYRWHGRYFAAEFPQPPEKVVRITDAMIVGDPGETNMQWEEGTMLRVIPEGARAKFEPGGASTRELQDIKRRMVAAAAPSMIVGRAGAFEVRRGIPGGPGGVAVDPRDAMGQVNDDRISYSDAAAALEERGWSANVVQRLMDPGAGGGGGGNDDAGGRLRVLGGCMKGSKGRGGKVGTPQRVTSAIFLRARDDQEAEGGSNLLCYVGGSDGKMYKFGISVPMNQESGFAGAPHVTLLSVAECHTGAITCLDVFSGSDGAVFSGGEDGVIRMWTTGSMQPFYTLQKDGFATEWKLGAAVRHLSVAGLKPATVGLDFENGRIVCATGCQCHEIHDFPIDPDKLRGMECEWSPLSPFSVVWAWKDPIRINYVGLSHSLTRILAGPGQVSDVSSHREGDADFVVCSSTGSVFAYTAGHEHQPLSVKIGHGGAVCASYSNSGTVIAVGTRGGCVVLLAASSLSIIFETGSVSGHPITHISFSPDNRMIAAACSGMKVRLLGVGGGRGFTPAEVALGEVVELGRAVGGHSAHITGMDWSKSSKHLRTSGLNYELLMWDAEADVEGGGIRMTQRCSLLRNESWDTSSCMAGWEVQGVWRRGRGEAHINSITGSQIEVEMQGVTMRRTIVTCEADGKHIISLSSLCLSLSLWPICKCKLF